MAMTGPGDYNAPVSCCGGQNPNSLLLYKCIYLGILTLNCSLKKKVSYWPNTLEDRIRYERINRGKQKRKEGSPSLQLLPGLLSVSGN